MFLSFTGFQGIENGRKNGRGKSKKIEPPGDESYTGKESDFNQWLCTRR
jgi:hypothetical protein